MVYHFQTYRFQSNIKHVSKAIKDDDHFLLGAALDGIDARCYRDSELRNLLHLAAFYGNVCMLVYFLRVGCDVNAEDKHGCTPLAAAMSCEDPVKRAEVVRLLLSSKAEVSVEDAEGKTALQLCFPDERDKDDFGTARVLIENGADVNIKSPYMEETLLHSAAFYGLTDRLDFLIRHGADVNALNYKNETPLHLAAQSVYERMLYDEDESISNSEEQSSESVETMKLLLVQGANANLENYKGQTPFHSILQYGDEHMVRVCLQHGADLRKKDRRGRGSIHFAAMNKRAGVLELVLAEVLDKVCKIDERTEDGKTALHIAVEEGLIENVKLLRKKGADINNKDNNGNTPLGDLISFLKELDVHPKEYNDERFVQQLLDLGADINARYSEGETILGMALYSRCLHEFILRLYALDEFRKNSGSDRQQLLGELVEDRDTLKEYFERCLDELKAMRELVICDKVSLLAILTGNQETIARYARNVRLSKSFDRINLKARYPIYGKVVKKTFTMEQLKHKIVKKSRDELTYSLPRVIRNSVVVDKIIEYLSWTDMIKLTGTENVFGVDPSTKELIFREGLNYSGGGGILL